MLTEQTIIDATTRQTFKRGEDLLLEGGVVSWTVHEGPSAGTQRIEGKVCGASSTMCTVTVVLDLENASVVDHGCTCAAHASFSGMCKHCVALSLAYIDQLHDGAVAQSSDVAEGAAPDGDTSREVTALLKGETQQLLARMGSGEAPLVRRGAIHEQSTSPQVTKLVYLYAAGQAESSLDQSCYVEEQAAPIDLVSLYPTIAPGCRIPGDETGFDSCTWELRLRIGSDRVNYVVKQIDELLAAYETRSTQAYGKNLEFCHLPSAFDERAARMLDLLLRVARAQEAARAAYRSWSGVSMGVTGKALVLSDRDVVELLDIMQGSSIQFEPRTHAGGGKTRPFEVVEGDPELEVMVKRGERGGFELSVHGCTDCVLTHERLYVFAAGRVWRCSEGYRRAMGALCRAALPAQGTFHIREADMAGFCSAVLPSVSEKAHVDMPQGLEVLLPPPAVFSFKFAIQRDQVVCDARVSYADVELDLLESVKPGQPLRDLAREKAARTLVRRHFDHYVPHGASRSSYGVPTAPLHWQGEEVQGRPCFEMGNNAALHAFLTQGVRAFSQFGEVYMAQGLRDVTVRPAPRVRVSVSVKSGLLDIEIGSNDLSPHDLLAYLASYERKEHFVRLTNGDLVRLDDGGVRALAELASGLGVEAAALVDGSAHVPVNRALFVDAMMKSSEGVRFDRHESFRSIIREFDSIGDNDFVEPQSLRDVLRPYQREGFKWISTLAKLGFGGILADEMGLGKTIQVIAFLLAQRESGQSDPSLVVCPASLVYNWSAEFARFAPELAVCAVAGTREERKRAITTARGYDVLITSYELLKRDIELYERQSFYCQVLDEAQYVKNPGTKAARTVKRVNASVRLALTGTPIENRLSELWSIFDYLMPGLLGSQDAFRKRFDVPAAEGDEEALKRLGCLVSPFILRRMKHDVLKDLPEKIETVVYANMEGEQEQLYRATASQLALTLAHQLPRDFAASRIAILAELTKLRQLCCDPSLVFENYEGGSAKLETCLELIANAVDGGHKVLLFSAFTSMLQIISDRLDKAGIAHHRLEGSTPKEERARLVESYATDDVPVFLISLKAGGVGLNLTAADIVIHYDPWWNLAAQNQATDRAHRIGQKNAVSVMRLIAKGSIEEKIVALQESKRHLAESIMGGEGVATASLTKEDILALLEV